MEEKELQNLTEQEFIEQYQLSEKDKYEKPSVTTDMAIFTVATGKVKDVRKKARKELQLLLVKRGGHPYKGDWALAGGFMGIDEDLDTSVQRELYEETGVSNVYAEQLYTWSDVDRDPRMRIISASYLALVDQEKLPPLRAGDDAVEALWFTVNVEEGSVNVQKSADEVVQTIEYVLRLNSGEDELVASVKKVTKTVGKVTTEDIYILDRGGLAFDHAEIIFYSLERLRGKVNYTNIAFNLVGDEFTLPDLQQVYEVILGKKINKVQFRRHVEGMVNDTGKEIKIGAYRPSKLYRYNMEWNYKTL